MHGLKTAFAFATALLGLTTLTGCPDEEPENFGTIRIEMAPLAGTVEIFNGTVEVVATVHYESCLVDFYMNRQPTYQQTGPDGAAVFEEWTSRLCSSEFSDIPDCEVTKIEQTLIPDNDVYTLKVFYKINDFSTLAYRELNVGPIPVEAFAECGSEASATVELQQSGLLGRNSMGQQIWRISTLPGSNVAKAGQGAPLRVELIANNNNP
ncbi:MAG TPA: hypothetical protein VM869_27940 [Enhygromyxa sp.]|nr:hypothetical protein [Enhygromyxa sp.]